MSSVTLCYDNREDIFGNNGGCVCHTVWNYYNGYVWDDGLFNKTANLFALHLKLLTQFTTDGQALRKLYTKTCFVGSKINTDFFYYNTKQRNIADMSRWEALLILPCRRNIKHIHPICISSILMHLIINYRNK